MARQKYNYNIAIGASRDKHPQWLQWGIFNALAVVGLGGSGKTTAAIYWMSQWAIQGVRFILCDPHMEADESLYVQTEHIHDAYISECVWQYEDITKRIQEVHTLGIQRIRGEILREQHYPLVLVIDEFTSYVINSPTSKKAAVTLLDATNQFRKVNIRVVLIGQTWGAAVAQTAGLRSAISDSVVFKSAELNAHKFISPANARSAKTLKPGQAYFQEDIVYIPRVTETDKLFTLERVAAYDYKPALKPAVLEHEYILHDPKELIMSSI